MTPSPSMQIWIFSTSPGRAAPVFHHSSGVIGLLHFSATDFAITPPAGSALGTYHDARNLKDHVYERQPRSAAALRAVEQVIARSARIHDRPSSVLMNSKISSSVADSSLRAACWLSGRTPALLQLVRNPCRRAATS